MGLSFRPHFEEGYEINQEKVFSLYIRVIYNKCDCPGANDDQNIPTSL
jgi:hypothetical protein